jgi:hypothetical protein
VSSTGKWDAWYAVLSVDDPEASGIRYGDGITYLFAAAFRAEVTEGDGWGCRTGAFGQFCRTKYLGIDGSRPPFASRFADPAHYRSTPDGILLRSRAQYR